MAVRLEQTSPSHPSSPSITFHVSDDVPTQRCSSLPPRSLPLGNNVSFGLSSARPESPGEASVGHTTTTSPEAPVRTPLVSQDEACQPVPWPSSALNRVTHVVAIPAFPYITTFPGFVTVFDAEITIHVHGGPLKLDHFAPGTSVDTAPDLSEPQYLDRPVSKLWRWCSSRSL